MGCWCGGEGALVMVVVLAPGSWLSPPAHPERAEEVGGSPWVVQQGLPAGLQCFCMKMPSIRRLLAAEQPHVENRELEQREQQSRLGALLGVGRGVN